MKLGLLVIIKELLRFILKVYLWVQWDDPEGREGEGGGRGVQDGEHMYIHG